MSGHETNVEHEPHMNEELCMSGEAQGNLSENPTNPYGEGGEVYSE